MTTAAPPRELGAYLRAGDEDIFALLTLPLGEPRGRAVVLLQGGAWTPSFGRGRGLRRLAHRLAAEGFHVARFDYHGVGESTGEVRTFRLDEPFTEDLAAVIRWLGNEHDLKRIVLMGTCFGARTALAGAADIPGLEGAALFPPPVRDLALGEQFTSYPFSWYVKKLFKIRTFRRLLNARFRRGYRHLVKNKMRSVGESRPRRSSDETSRRALDASPAFLRNLKALLARGLPVYVLYGDADADYEDFARARSGELGSVMDRAGRQLRLDVIRGHVHGMTNIENQDLVIDLLTEWVTSAPTTSSSAGL